MGKQAASAEPLESSDREIAKSSNASQRILLERRTRAFAVAIIRFVATFPRRPEHDVVGRQLLKAASSIGANYREANRAESRNDFAHKLAIAEKEAAETCYWLELIEEANLAKSGNAARLLHEADELLKIFTSATRTMKRRR